jgi:DNA primase
MDETSKYLIHASLTADGVIERSDVVGAIFGQTEGLLGDDLDLRDLQQSSKVGRIDVEVTSEGGQSFGHVTIASSLDRVETAILAASLETITRVGPCQAHVEVTDIEDVREAKRREVVERAKELLVDSFDESIMTSAEILEEVRESVRVEDITEYADLPAGPRVDDSDAVIVVEGRADVLTLLKYGIKNAVAVEGTNVPDSVADLTEGRTVTAFLDGDRGGELILRELAQVGDVDYVAFAPEGRSVEDLGRSAVMRALREKIPYGDLEIDAVEGGASGDPTDGRTATTESPTPEPATTAEAADSTDGTERTGALAAPGGPSAAAGTSTEADELADTDTEPSSDAATNGEADGDVETDDSGTNDSGTDDDGDDHDDPTLPAHVRAVVDGGTGRSRLLDVDMETLADVAVEDTFTAIRDADAVPHAVVVDGEVSQRLLDVAAQRGVEHLVGRSTGEFVKQPVGVRVRTADQLRVD